MNTNLLRGFALAAVAVLLIACGDTPGDVADGFWGSCQRQDVAGAWKHINKRSQASFTLDTEGEPIRRYVLGVATVEDDHAQIPTTVVSGDETQNFVTLLSKEDGDWKVDVQATMFALHGGAGMAQAMQKMTEQLSRDMERTMSDMTRQMQSQLEQATRR